MNKEDKKAIILFVIVVLISIPMFIYFNVKEHQDFVNDCKNKGGTIIYQDYPQRTFCSLGDKENE